MAWHLMGVSSNTITTTSTWLIDSEDDLQSVPDNDGNMGSIAYTADMSVMAQKDASGDWVKMG